MSAKSLSILPCGFLAEQIRKIEVGAFGLVPLECVSIECRNGEKTLQNMCFPPSRGKHIHKENNKHKLIKLDRGHWGSPRRGSGPGKALQGTRQASPSTTVGQNMQIGRRAPTRGAHGVGGDPQPPSQAVARGLAQSRAS